MVGNQFGNLDTKGWEPLLHCRIQK